MPGVHLRPACAQDLPGIADLAARAMLEDELFAYLCPGRYEHYSHFRYAFLRRLKTRLVTPRYVMIVAVENEGSGESICGVDPHRLEQYLASAVDCFPFSDFPQNWFLSTVAVDPVHQRRGIGQQLIQWGLQQGLQDNVPVGLEASLKGFALYERLGFRTVNELELRPGIIMRAMICDTNTLSNMNHS
ncbi:GNAT family acetyltransferase [Penicillium brevicompactum]|uniref:GNAT family acetyltransferase n=1 Tax=Penicillium brevicompactum TaxID=5074 RepID=UPI002540BCE8|nr:GNAT family acetyltransferase [Penicillium brevicompactum]KAJ5344345.1 GNAT family acetyltransferase [Penicillium brevicompactum]